MTIQIGTDACEPGTIAGIAHSKFQELYGEEAASSDTVKGVAYSIAYAIVEGLRTQISDGEAVGRSGSNLAGIEVDGGGGGAPSDAQYITAASNGTLSAERVATTTASVVWDFSVAGQAKATVPAASTVLAGVVALATSIETTAALAVQASDTRLSDARTPTAHKTSHQFGGGADAIKLDDLDTPDDNTDLNATTGQHGLLRKLDNNAAHYLDGQGNWSTATPAAHASSHSSGSTDPVTVTNLAGYPGTTTTYMRGDATFATFAHASSHMSAGSDPIRIDELKIGTDIVTLNSSTTEHGLLPKLDGSTGKFLNGNGAWTTLAGPGAYADEPISFSSAVTSGVAFTVLETAAIPEGFAGAIVYEFYLWGGTAGAAVCGHHTGSRANLRRLTGGNLALSDTGQTATLGEGTSWTPTVATNGNNFRVQLTITTTTTVYVRGFYRIYGAVLA